MKRKCAVDECGSPSYCRALCAKHYQRLRAYGSTDSPRKSPLQRFFDQLIPVTESGCWLWTGCTNRMGYGRFNVRGGPVLAHRFSWELHFGAIPSGMFVCHKCDTPLCVNPGHLFIGTNADNVADMKAKGRASLGPRKLTDEQVIEIRRRPAWPAKAAAEHFGVSRGHISDLRRGLYRNSTK